MVDQRTLTVNGTPLALDENGYLANMNEWNDDVVQAFAEQENITLSDAHWEVIRFVRDYYQEYGTSPAIRLLVKAVGASLGADKGNSRYLYRLFPKGPAKQATRLAGIPKPVNCI